MLVILEPHSRGNDQLQLVLRQSYVVLKLKGKIIRKYIWLLEQVYSLFCVCELSAYEKKQLVHHPGDGRFLTTERRQRTVMVQTHKHCSCQTCFSSELEKNLL